MPYPPKYDPEKYIPELLRRVGNGELLCDLYGKDGFPSSYVVHGELTRLDGRWQQAYARAREQQAHAIAEKAVRDVEKTIDPEQAQLARLKFDARRWLVGKIAPRIYGDKTTHTIEAGESYVEALRLANDKIRQKEKEARRIIDVDPETGNEIKKLGNNTVKRKGKNIVISDTFTPIFVPSLNSTPLLENCKVLRYLFKPAPGLISIRLDLSSSYMFHNSRMNLK